MSGLGVLPMLCCPHYDVTGGNGVQRAVDFTTLLQQHQGEYALGIDNWAAIAIDGDAYRVIGRANRTGSVGPDGTSFAPNSTGTPGAWALEVDASTGELVRTVLPETGSVDDLLRPPRYVSASSQVAVARHQNPDDGAPAAWNTTGFLASHNFRWWVD